MSQARTRIQVLVVLALCGSVLLLSGCALFHSVMDSSLIRPPTHTPELSPTLIPVNPSVQFSADRTEVQPGETITLTAVPVDLGLAVYTLTLSSGASVRVTFEGQVEQSQDDAVFAIESVDAELWEATFVLRALAPGSVDAHLHVSGEVHQGYPGPAYWGGGSAQLSLTVLEQP
jgi:hypothetical protein